MDQRPGCPGTGFLRDLARTSVLSAAVLASSACFVVIDPRDVVETPSVSGTLRDSARPAAGVALWISPVWAHGACEMLREPTRTGPDGSFAFEETRVHRTVEFVPLAPSTPAYTVQVCMDDGDGARPLYRETFRGALPRHVNLTCELAPATSGASQCQSILEGRQQPGFGGTY